MNHLNLTTKEFLCFEYMSDQLARIESNLNVSLNQYEGKYCMRYIPRTTKASDFCFYFAPEKPKDWMLNLWNVARLRKSVDRFLERIGSVSDLPSGMQLKDRNGNIKKIQP